MLFGQGKGKVGRPWRLSAKLPIACSVVTVLGFSAICTSVMLDMRRGEESLAGQSLENLASGIDSDISRNIELYDLSLRNVATGGMDWPALVNAADKALYAAKAAGRNCCVMGKMPSLSLVA